MSEQQVWVDIELDSELVNIGQLWTRFRNGRESASFEYSKSWLRHNQRFALEPALLLQPGQHHTNSSQRIFGALGDSAPDRWGRLLIKRNQKLSHTDHSSLNEIDFLLAVNDTTRQGALRFRATENGPYLNNQAPAVPPIMELKKLLAASEHVIAAEDTFADLQLILAPGSSLGGARPKASILDNDNNLSIAKFPSKTDEHPVILWEAVALSLAKASGITTPTWHLEHCANQPILISKRFDRKQKTRTPYLSAMSMLGATDNETRSYLEIAEALHRYGAQPKQDLQELYRRMLFNIIIANTDDHLRNHGFLYQASGWTLAPAFDLNPTPSHIKPRILSTNIDFDHSSGELELALSVSEHFSLSLAEAKKLQTEILKACSSWREQAKRLGIKQRQIDEMSSAFLS